MKGAPMHQVEEEEKVPVKAAGRPERKPRCGHVARVKAQILEDPVGGSWREKP